MKKIYFAASVLFMGLTSCSSSDDSSNNSDPTAYLPLAANTSWVYDVSLDENTLGQDVLSVIGESTLNGKTYSQLQTADVPNGFYTNALNENYVRVDGDKILLTGSTGLGLSQLLPIDIDVTDFVIFKENASNNTELESLTGTVEQDLQDIPLIIDYTLKSFFKESLATFTVPGKLSYTDVKVIKMIVTMKVTTLYTIPGLGTPLTVSILDSQDVVVSTQYYAEGVGMIYAKTDVNFQINDFSQFGIVLPIPQEGSSVIEEFLN